MPGALPCSRWWCCSPPPSTPWSCPSGPGPGSDDGGDWAGTWYAAPVGAEPGGDSARTVRNVVHTSLGGSLARVTVSNLFGNAPLDLRHTTLATVADPARTMRTLTFRGLARVSVPAGAEVVSDPLAFEVLALGDLYVSVYAAGPVTWHPGAQQTSFVARVTSTARPIPGCLRRSRALGGMSPPSMCRGPGPRPAASSYSGTR